MIRLAMSSNIFSRMTVLFLANLHKQPDCMLSPDRPLLCQTSKWHRDCFKKRSWKAIESNFQETFFFFFFFYNNRNTLVLKSKT